LITGYHFKSSENGVVCPAEQSTLGPNTDAIYVIYKKNNGALDVKEYRIQRYRGSAVLKNPFFTPEKGYQGIVQFRGDKKQRPVVIQQFAEYIRNHFSALSENNHGDRMVQLFFYADVDELAHYNKSFKKRVREFFKGPAPRKKHPLIAALRNIQGIDACDIKDGAPFDYTNVFVAQEVTLENLKTINEHIILIDNQFRMTQ
jgi:hypothetical protein